MIGAVARVLAFRLVDSAAALLSTFIHAPREAHQSHRTSVPKLRRAHLRLPCDANASEQWFRATAGCEVVTVSTVDRTGFVTLTAG